MVLSKLHQPQTQNISPPSFLPNSNQSPEPPVPQTAEVPGITYAAPNHDVHILADILPPSAPSSSLHPPNDRALPNVPIAARTGFPSYSGLAAQTTGYAVTHAAQPGLQSPQTSFPIHGQPLSQIGFSGQTPQTSFGLQSGQPASLNGFSSASVSFPHSGSQVAGAGIGMGMCMGAVAPGAGAMGLYGANQPMAMARPMHVGMSMNIGQGVQMQQPAGFPPGSTMRGGYSPTII
ncbi:hypothetical protein BC332_06288 [Capsicum chinense]|nr:hypothetical protein BC332_06288 [Capsicum chinense]